MGNSVAENPHSLSVMKFIAVLKIEFSSTGNIIVASIK
jgi:hypothetical protein